eukprot:XP_001709947.1 Hypothetical protein GL50803_118483 [Giardia lamblia ATCC 50803]
MAPAGTESSAWLLLSMWQLMSTQQLPPVSLFPTTKRTHYGTRMTATEKERWPRTTD